MCAAGGFVSAGKRLSDTDFFGASFGTCLIVRRPLSSDCVAVLFYNFSKAGGRRHLKRRRADEAVYDYDVYGFDSAGSADHGIVCPVGLSWNLERLADWLVRRSGVVCLVLSQKF